ncbi:MAG: iron ABC transporter permease, partial [Bdellovibrionota bacterium]
LFTYVLLILLKAFEAIDPTMEEASRMSGASTWQTFRNITLPLLRAPLFNGFLLAFLATTASFGVPALIGTPGGIFLLTTQIYTFQRMGSMSGILKASSLSLILMALAFVILLLSEGPLRIRQFATISGKTPRPQLARLGFWKLPLTIAIGTTFTILFLLPLSAIFLAAFSQVQGILTWSNFGWSNFERILFHTDETTRAFSNSLIFAGVAGIFCVLAGFGLAYALKYVFSSRLKGVTSILVSLPYVTPGTVLALALLVGFGPGIVGNWFALNSTGLLIILAYSIKYLNFSYKTLEDGVGQIHPCLDEASRLSGAGTFQTMRYIWWPLLRPSLIASFFLVFMPAMFEVTMTVLLTGPGLETLGAFIFHLQEYGDLGGGGPAVLALLIIIPTGLFNFFLKFISKGKYGL